MKTSTALYFTAVVLVSILSFTIRAEAQQQSANCNKLEKFLDIGAKNYNEHPWVGGLFNKSPNRLLILKSVDGNTFTVFSVKPNGVACVIGSGTGAHQFVTPNPVDKLPKT